MKVKIIFTALFLITGFLWSAKPADAQRKTFGRVCGTPIDSCFGARYGVLDFEKPKKIKLNVPYRSASVFIVLLKNYESPGTDDCGDRYKPEWRKTQKLFPNKKVFYAAECADLAQYNYIGLSGKLPANDFLGVYAGKSQKEANETLADVKKSGKFPQAQIYRIRIEYSEIDA